MQASMRKNLQGRMANHVLAMGNVIKAEKLSYCGWQKVFGRSIAFRAPGMFMELLRRKAERAGGQVQEFFPGKTKLSQTCHQCGKVEKKSLSTRGHHCSCGIDAQRDLYSAFLALHVSGDELDRSKATIAWPGAKPLLSRALSICNQTMTGRLRLASFGLNRGNSGSREEGESAAGEAGNVVARSAGESPGEPDGLVSRTPWL